MTQKNLRIFTCVWGEKYIDWFMRGTVRSFSWKDNKEAIDGSTWHIATKEEHALKLEHDLASRFPNVRFEFSRIPKELKTPGGDMLQTDKIDHSNLILMHLIKEIKAALNTNSRTLLAPPDTIFGERSIRNLLLIGEQEHTCVAVPHPRILPDILEDGYFKTENSCANEQLVKMVFEKYAHQSWKAAELGCQVQNTLVGGVVWRKLYAAGGESLYAVQHRIPTVYLANWSPEDYNFFLNQPSFGCYDHTWPGMRLIRQERQRLVASSDACFIGEITEFDRNNPPWNIEMLKVLQDVPDAFYKDDLHACMNRLTVCIFRGR